MSWGRWGIGSGECGGGGGDIVRMLGKCGECWSGARVLR